MATVFTTGASVLIFEIIAVRALAPYFGASMYVVSSVLTVVLAALSIGYYIGGRLADQYPDARFLYGLLSLGGFLMSLLYVIFSLMATVMSAYFPITIGPLIITLLFFFMPAFLLGIDSPFVIKLLTIERKNNDDSGTTAGSTYFWSTLGSIMGSLLTGFLFIPFFGVDVTVFATATSLTVLSFFAYVTVSDFLPGSVKIFKQSHFIIFILGSLFCAVLILDVDNLVAYKENKVLFSKDGYYSHITVLERFESPTKVVRSLVRDVNHSSAIMLGSTEFMFQYTEYARVYRALQDETKSFLMIGGGAYSIPRTLILEDPVLEIDVVEIEPGLYDLAQKYFDLPTSERLTNYTMDARVYLNRTDMKYDFIFVDVFSSGLFIPSHLTTVEFVNELKQHLNTQGVLVVNIVGVIDKNERSLTGSLVKTFQSVFPELRVYNASNNQVGLKNFILVAKKDGTPSELPADFEIDLKNSHVVSAATRMLPLDTLYLEKQIVFTDDKAPVELLLTKQMLNLKSD